MPLENNWFRKHTPEEIVAMVSTLTLATISTWTQEELDRIGWTNNPIIDILYGLTSAGTWTSIVDPSGHLEGAFDSSIETIVSQSRYMDSVNREPSVSGYIAPTGSNVVPLVRRTKILTFVTNGAGAAAAQALHTGPAGFYPVVRIKRVISNVIGGATEMLFTVTGGALVGPAQVNIALVAHTINEQMKDLLLYNLTDASVINLAINAGPISANVYVEVEYWSET